MQNALLAVGIREGEIIADKYRVDRVLGAGGMGVVIAAYHLQLDKKVAIKFLLPEAVGQPDAVARFIREARAAVKIENEHVARVSDVGTLPNGAPFMVMELLEGGDLAAWLRQRGALPVEQAVEFVLQACVAVADAHALGIVHRDLKPANLFCVRRSDGQLCIKVLDFGISKVTTPAGAGASVAMTQTAVAMGTPLYMSPEQMRSSKDVDSRTDIWALGAILFELVAGRPAFSAESLTELAIRVASEPPASLRALRPNVPAALEAVVGKCLEKDRARRFRDVGQLAVALEPFALARARASVERVTGIMQAAGRSEGAPALSMARLGGGTLTSPGTLLPMNRTAADGPPRAKRAVAAGAGLFGLLVVGAAGFALLSRTVPPRQEESKRDAGSAAAPASAPGFAAALVEPGIPTVNAAGPPDVSLPVNAATPVASASAPARGAPRAETKQTGPAATASHPKVATTMPAAHAASPAASTAPLPNCNPPYFFDSDGHKQYKPECL